MIYYDNNIYIYNEHVWAILGFQAAALIQTFQVCHALCGGRLPLVTAAEYFVGSSGGPSLDFGS